ncbi:MAG: pantetheine-phosphate adenylyltransferase [Euryarchaeota archaeon]|jgi:cytidyltransferase-like protein|nr:pantetheine-phosphate adenylyltransferase [Euryarchaeota archaeon]
MPPFSLCLLGGTFDRFHVGHHNLISTCLKQADKVQIWLTSDVMANSKNPLILDWETRQNEIIKWAEQIGVDTRITIHHLEDIVGPAPTSELADSIGCTSETRPACESINNLRMTAALPLLEIIEVNHAVCADGEIISSNRIRAGEINRQGQPWLGDAEMYLNQKMPGILDDELKKPFGTLHEGPETKPEVAMKKALESISQHTPKIIAVGDVTVQTMIDMGEIPDIAFVDGMTKREIWADAEKLDRTKFPHLSTCINPPGLITADLKLATKVALSNSRPTLVVVSGEEDLAPIVVHLLAPLGCAVLYGQPTKGVVVRITSQETKENCRRLLDVFTQEM